MNIAEIIKFIDDYLLRTGQHSIAPVEANAILERAGLLRDSKDRPGKPLRDLLRKGLIPHAYQSGGKGSSWVIPHSSKGATVSSVYPEGRPQMKEPVRAKTKQDATKKVDILQLKKQLEQARLKYKPDEVNYLLIAEAPPDSIDRFFYYDDVRKHDYLFLGITKALWPELKDKYIVSGRRSDIKHSVLLKLQQDGFYLLDLSELPLSYMSGDLHSQVPVLLKKMETVVNESTKIILIKSTVYATAFHSIRENYGSQVVDCKIPFPGQGWQEKFQARFKEALRSTMNENITYQSKIMKPKLYNVGETYIKFDIEFSDTNKALLREIYQNRIGTSYKEYYKSSKGIEVSILYDEGSLKIRIIIYSTVLSLYIGIGQYGSFRTGVREIVQDSRNFSEFVIDRYSNDEPNEVGRIQRVERRRGFPGRLNDVYDRIDNLERGIMDLTPHEIQNELNSVKQEIANISAVLEDQEYQQFMNELPNHYTQDLPLPERRRTNYLISRYGLKPEGEIEFIDD